MSGSKRVTDPTSTTAWRATKSPAVRFLVALACELDGWTVYEQNGSWNLVAADGANLILPTNNAGGMQHSKMRSAVAKLLSRAFAPQWKNVLAAEAMAGYTGSEYIAAEKLVELNPPEPVAVLGRVVSVVEPPVTPEQIETVEHPQPEQPHPPKDDPDMTTPKITRGIGEAVHQHLIDANGPRTTKAIAEATGFRRDQVNSAAYHLIQAGVIRRLKTGVYEATQARTSRIDVQHHTDTVVMPAPAAAPASVPVIVSTPAPAPTVMDAAAEDTMNDVLDLMFPDGFKARHLPAIEAWKAATIRLMGEVLS